MAQQPTNPKLWMMYIAQARAKYSTYPSPAASHWVHDHYIKSGGQFFDPAEINRHKEAVAKYHEAVSKHNDRHNTDSKKHGDRKNAK